MCTRGKRDQRRSRRADLPPGPREQSLFDCFAADLINRAIDGSLSIQYEIGSWPSLISSVLGGPSARLGADFRFGHARALKQLPSPRVGIAGCYEAPSPLVAILFCRRCVAWSKRKRQSAVLQASADARVGDVRQRTVASRIAPLEAAFGTACRCLMDLSGRSGIRKPGGLMVRGDASVSLRTTDVYVSTSCSLLAGCQWAS